MKEDINTIQSTLAKARTELWKVRALKAALHSYLDDNAKPKFCFGMANEVLDILEEQLEAVYYTIIDAENALDKLPVREDGENADT